MCDSRRASCSSCRTIKVAGGLNLHHSGMLLHPPREAEANPRDVTLTRSAVISVAGLPSCGEGCDDRTLGGDGSNCMYLTDWVKANGVVDPKDALEDGLASWIWLMVHLTMEKNDRRASWSTFGIIVLLSWLLSNAFSNSQQLMLADLQNLLTGNVSVSTKHTTSSRPDCVLSHQELTC